MNSGFTSNPDGYIKNFNSLRIVCLWAGGLGLYPPRSRPESTIHEHAEQQKQPTSPIIVTAFPAPDYTPPMQRAAQNSNRDQRFQH
ncbi:hypothetical protein EVAR_67618_1 [Eumeta japonica]|uniref:Uncharacterized protein n=1 Tax=Eumeta variegata TaxID=151549 RepID=A0A4C1SL30_EUMVA|nr:hypothetical protein EVAR_67618_1 [Eumeta japonica]